MGAKNAMAAYAMYPQLGHGPMRLLVGMALTALDDAHDERPPRLYFGGEDALADLLGGPSKRSRVYEYMRTLDDLGAVTNLVRGRAGKRAVYRLHLDPLEGPVSRNSGPSSVPENGTLSVPENGMQSVPESGTPRSNEGTTQETNFKENSSPTEPQGWAFGTASDNEGFAYEQASKAVQAKHGITRAYELAEAYRQAHGLDDIKAATIALAEQDRQAAA